MDHLSYPRRDLTDMEIGWLAGIYEGEGTAYLRIERRGPNGAISRSVRVCICMTDRDVVQRIQDLFPSPSAIAERKRKPHERRQYEWRISQRALVAEFLALTLPLLGERRRDQALRVLAVATDPRGGLGSGHRNKTHCPQGHEYTPENTRSNSGSTMRRCKACERTYRQNKAEEAKQRAQAR